MSDDALIAALLAARQVVRRDNPDLFLWCNRQWDSWLRSQQAVAPDLSNPALLAVAALTCIEDLPLHVALMQLIALPGVRCDIVLSLPSEEMARIVRAHARRDAWEGLVHIASEADCAEMLGRLSARTAVAVLPGPALLSTKSSWEVAEFCRSLEEPPKDVILPAGAGFLGLAGNLGDSSVRLSADQEQILSALRLIRSQDPRSLGTAADTAPLPRHDSRETRAWAGVVHSDEGRVDLPDVGHQDELLVVGWDDNADPAVVARRRADLSGTDRRMRLRAPPSLLTTTARQIRVEARSAGGEVTGTNLLFEVAPSRLEPWMISAFLNRGGGGKPVIRAFAQGVGCRIAYAEDEPDRLRDIPVVWGVLRDSDRIIAQAKAQSLHFFYIDHAYFDRGHGKSYRITRNRYEAGPIRKCPDDRISELGIDVHPWRKAGREIIVCPPTEYFMQAHNCFDWLDETLAALQQLTDRPIKVRLKPQPGEIAVPLPRALETAHALVTHSSNVAIEAACLGTPVFVSPASAAAPIGRTDLAQIETPVYPDRGPWLAHLAYNQFSFEEIRRGDAWRMLLSLEERELV